jgi:vesicular inhibitory amino acid transporter
MSPTQNLDSHQWNAPIITPTRPPAPGVPQERTPLIRKANSFNIPTTKRGYGSIERKRKTKPRTKPPPRTLPLEPFQKVQEITPVKHYPPGRSTFGQTVSITNFPHDVLTVLFSQLSSFKLFNSIATLLGIGMMAEPLAFSYAGWGWGTLLLIFYGWVTCRTWVFFNGCGLRDFGLSLDPVPRFWLDSS